jgi:hypothetical protein
MTDVAGAGTNLVRDTNAPPPKPEKPPAKQDDAATSGDKSQQRAVPATTQGIGAGPAVVNQLDSDGSKTSGRARSESQSRSARQQQDVNAGANNNGRASNQTQDRIDVAGRPAAQPVSSAPTRAAEASSQPDEPQLDLNRKVRIDSWLNEHNPANPQTTQAPRASDVTDILKSGLPGKGGDDGRLRPEEQRYFLKRVLPMLDQRQVEDLALAVKEDGSVRTVVAEGLRDTALDFARNGKTQIQARIFALNLVRAMDKDLHGLGMMIIGVRRPEDAAVIPLILGNQKLTDHRQAGKNDPRLNDPKTLAQARDQLVVAVSAVDVTEANRKTINTVTLAFREKASPSDLQNAPAFSAHLASLMARQYAWTRSVNGDPINPVLLAGRFERVLDTQNGAAFLCLGQSDKKSAAWDAVAGDDSVDRATFEKYSDPSKSPAIARGMAIWKIKNTHDGEGKLIASPDDKKTVDRVAGIVMSSGYEVMFGPAPLSSRDFATQNHSRTFGSHRRQVRCIDFGSLHF